jgi:glycosyltransferase involved in cell wall biosynthesis
MEKKLKICVYAISKNEAHFVQRFCESAVEADMILIADTGSDDGLPEKAANYGAVIHHISISPWRFDLARNAALALVPRDMDVCISLDIDEVLQPGWREEIERVWIKGETTRLRYMFDWGCGISFYYEKIHARHGYLWWHPVHEYPVPDGRITEIWAQTDFLIAVHKPDPTKSRGQYMDLLELSVKEDPQCPRNAFYYARELSFNSRWQEAIDACQSYLALPRATWANERCYAYRVMGRCYNELGNPTGAEKAFQMAASEAPNTREPWCELAMLMYRQARWEESFAYAMRALRITNREAVYTCDPEVWGFQAHDLASIAAWNLGIYGPALHHAKIAHEMAPEDVRLAANLEYIRNAISGDNEKAA